MYRSYKNMAPNLLAKIMYVIKVLAKTHFFQNKLVGPIIVKLTKKTVFKILDIFFRKRSKTED